MDSLHAAIIELDAPSVHSLDAIKPELELNETHSAPLQDALARHKPILFRQLCSAMQLLSSVAVIVAGVATVESVEAQITELDATLSLDALECTDAYKTTLSNALMWPIALVANCSITCLSNLYLYCRYSALRWLQG